MRSVLILALLLGGCAALPPPFFDEDTTMAHCGRLPPEHDAYFDPCMKRAFANIPVAPDVKKMPPPVVKGPAAPYWSNQHDWNKAGMAVDNAMFCAGTWENAWDAATCTSRMNRKLGMD
jgi:hypothetical protein